MKGIHNTLNKVQYLWLLVQEYEVLLMSQIFTFIKQTWNYKKNKRNKLVNALKKQIRVYGVEYKKNTYITSKNNDSLSPIQYQRVLCFWILLEYISTVDEHFATGTYSKISMIIEGKDYDILYVKEGDEKICLSHINENGDTLYLIVVENKKQINLLSHDKIKTFATVTLFGEIKYYERS